MIKFDLKKCINDVLKDIDNSKPNVYFSANLCDLNEILSVVKKGSVITIGGRPLVGKTSFSFSVVWNLLSKGQKVLLHSMDLSARNYLKSFLYSTSGIDYNKLWNKKLTNDEKNTLFSVAKQVENSSLLIDDSIIVDINKIEDNIKQENPDILIIDPIQLLQKNLGNQKTMETIMKNIKRIALENNIIVILLSQLNGEKDVKNNILADLKDIAIAEISDIVIIIDYESYYNIENNNSSKIIINR